MPFAFPSHQGLVLPLARRFPRHIDAVALSIGAALPDIIDACAFPFRRTGEELGQGIGHSLLGVLLFTPIGLVIAWLVRRFVPRRLDNKTATHWTIASMALGDLTHVFFDFISHANFVVLLPWYKGDSSIFPHWWTIEWARVAVPIYTKPYPIAPHTIVWFILSILGAVMFVRHVKRLTRS